MQNQITEVSNSNRLIFGQIKESLEHLGKNTENDFLNLNELVKQIPSNMNYQDKKKLLKLLNTMEVKLKTYESELDKIESKIQTFEKDTTIFLDTIQNPKGVVATLKHSLSQSTIEQITILTNLLDSLTDATMSMDNLIAEIKTAAGFDEVKMNKIKNYVNQVLKEEITNIKSTFDLKRNTNNENLDTLLNNHAGVFSSEIARHDYELNNVKQVVEKNIIELNQKIYDISSIIDAFKIELKTKKREFEKIEERIIDELNQFKTDTKYKFNTLERGIETNMVKRYI